MKAPKASEVFVPEEEDEDLEASEDEVEEKKPASGADKLLGNAFDAFQEGDREGFVRSMRAAMRAR